jgi:diaminopimelate epimerase
LGVGFVKLRSDGQTFLVVNVVDSLGEAGKDLARSLCGEIVGAAGLALIRHDGHGGFQLECFEPDGSPSWQNEPMLGRLVACAAQAIRSRYGNSRPILVCQRMRLAAMVEQDRVLVSGGGHRARREYRATALFRGEAVWPPVESSPPTGAGGHWNG